MASHHSATIHASEMSTSLEDQSDIKKDLDSKSEDLLADREDRVEQMIKFDVNQHPEIAKKLNINLGAEYTMHIKERLLKEK